MVAGFLRFLLGLVLIPLGIAMTQSAVDVVNVSQAWGQAAVPPTAWAFGGGFFLWLLIYFTLPQPVRTYVLAHELTHALWGALMGARVSSMRIYRDRGSVTLSKTNFLITLAPYFFPLYTVLVIGLYYLLGIWVDVSAYELVWLALVGFTWSFHLTFTVRMLLQHQSDIRECGFLFSYTVIYLLNVLGVALWVVLVGTATLSDLADSAISRTTGVAVGIWDGMAAWCVAVARMWKDIQ